MQIAPKKIFPNYDFRHSFLLFCLTFLFSLQVFAERLPLKIYTSADGLGSGFVNSIASDSRGFMWFGTRDGLSRFDGANFVTYQIGDKKTQPGVEQFYESKSGIYWITTTGGTYRFDPNKIPAADFATSKLNAELVEENRGLIFEDSKGNLWSTATGLSLIREKDGKVEFEKFELNFPPEFKSKMTVLEITEAPDSSLWMSVNTGLLRLLPSRQLVYYPYGENRTAGNSDLVADKKGNVWFASGNNLFVLKPKPIEFYKNSSQMAIESFNASTVIEIKAGKPYQLPQKDGEIFRFSSNESNRFLERSFAKKFFQSSNQTIWVSNENSLLEFKNGIFELYTDKEGLPTVMTGLGEDSAGNLWVGGHDGLARISLNGMISYGSEDGSASSRFFIINEARNGTLYFLGFEFYLSQFKENRLNSVRPQIPLESGILWTSRPAFLDSNQNWWFATNNKLYHFAGISDFTELKTKLPKIYSTEDGLKSNAVYSIFEDSSGNFWVSTHGSNAGEISTSRLKKGENKFYVFTESEGLPAGKSFASAVEDPNGNIWFTFYQGGVARFNGEKFEYWGNSEFLEGALLDIYLDKNGHLWIASAANGLYRVQNLSDKQPEFVNFSTANGLSSNNVRTVIGDNFGRIYLGTARGVDRLSPDTGFVKHFSVNDGLAADFVADSHRDQNGNLWFATNNGASKFTPLPEEKAVAPKILLGKLLIAGETQPIPQLGTTEIEKGELSANQNNLQIDFFGLDFRAGETLRYQYKLEGIDTDWKPPTEQRTVNFSNLSPGNYRFLVRAVNSEGQISENPVVVSFKILQPIYFRWWFIFLGVLLISGIAFAFYKYRLSKLQQVNLALQEAKDNEEKLSRERKERLSELQKVRARIATDLHDDIGSSLSQISLYSELARQKELESGKAGEQLDMITNVANELVDTMSDIVWAINPKKDHLQDLTQRMRRFAADVLTAREIDLEFQIPETDHEIPLGANIRREVFLIFKETVNNIAKHSEATEAKIKFSLRDHSLFITFEDNGKGFDQTEKLGDNGHTDWKKFRGGNGLLNMRKRAEELGGDYDIKSEIGKGTVVILSVPLELKEEKLSTDTHG